MKYSLSSPAEVTRAKDYLNSLIEKKALVEIKKVSPRRTLSQNNYFYLLLAAFAQHYGYTTEEAKTLFKREVNPDLFIYEKNGQKFLRSSRDLTKEQMMKAIDRFRDYSAEQGYPLPLATDQEWLQNIENLIEMQERYL